MKLMILASALAFSATAHADDARYEAQLTTCELVVTLDNIAEESAELAELAAKRGRKADAKALGNLAASSLALANQVDRQILSPLERGATLAYARAQLGRLSSAFQLVDLDSGSITKMSRYLEAELEYAGALKRELTDILSRDGRGRNTRDALVSH